MLYRRIFSALRGLISPGVQSSLKVRAGAGLAAVLRPRSTDFPARPSLAPDHCRSDYCSSREGAVSTAPSHLVSPALLLVMLVLSVLFVVLVLIVVFVLIVLFKQSVGIVQRVVRMHR